MKVLLELLRIIFIFGIISGFAWYVVGDIYTINETAASYRWIGGLAVYLFLFILYRNKLQFSGWYKGTMKKLSTRTTRVLTITGVVLLVFPFLLPLISS